MHPAAAAMAWAGLGLAGQGPPPTAPTLELNAVRFYRSDGAQTLFDVYWHVPLAVLEPVGAGRHADAAYRVTLAVRDSTGLPLMERSWVQTVPARLLGVAGGSAAESFSFAAQAGRYTVAVAVADSASGRRQAVQLDLLAYDGPPAASDLLLASGVRAATSTSDTVPQAGEVRKGGLIFQTSGRPVLTPQQSRLAYYLELYGGRPDTVSVTARVLGVNETQILSTAPQRVPVSAEGGATRGTLDLAGLPRGAYRLELALHGAAGRTVRSGAFGMAGFGTDSAIAAAAPGPRDVFHHMSDAQLDTVYLPLIYVMTDQERGLYPGLSVGGKRSYLRQFWARRDPTPGTAANEEQEDFYRRIAEANRRYREGGTAQIPGWRTDRGRIFIRHGLPDEVLSRPQAGSTFPYEVWKYSRGRLLKYVFADLTRFGNYALVYTDDRGEPSRPDWQALLGPDAVEEVGRF